MLFSLIFGSGFFLGAARGGSGVVENLVDEDGSTLIVDEDGSTVITNE